MASKYCTQCGGENRLDASFCQYCGTALPAAPSAPLPPSGSGSPTAPPPPAAPGWTSAGYPPPTPTAPKRRRWGVIILAVIVAFLLVGGVIFLLAPSGPDVVVTGINFTSPDNACGLDGSTDSGFNASAGDSLELTYEISGNTTVGNATAACDLRSIVTTTPGFSLSGANTPLAVPANSTQLLSFSVNVPDATFTGVLTLVLT